MPNKIPSLETTLIIKGIVVPTTTPPLVGPSNGKNKEALTKIFTSYTYGGFEIM